MPERDQRRLTTILAADVAGYSRLTGADEEGTLRRLRTLRAELIDPAIQSSRGRVFKTTGDGLLAEFVSVVDAARCAIAIQHGLEARNADFIEDKRIAFRVGIHLGDVIVESDGDLMGDGVNIAARLEGMAEPGGICLSNAAYEQVRDKIAERFSDLGDRELKNIARPMRVFAINLTSARGGATKEPPRLSIVVLPFANMGGDPEQEYFVDGVTENLTTDLSRIGGSFVIARNTAFTYKGKHIDVKQVGRELGVRYVLEGSMQRGGNRLRVNVQLIDTESGAHLWAERFDKPLADLFDMQDEIVARLAGELNAELVEAEARRAERAPHPDSMDLYFQGMAGFHKGLTADNSALVRNLFERALALDPGNIEALVGGALVDVAIAGTFFGDDRVARVAAAEAAVVKALSLAPDHATAHFVLSGVHVLNNRSAQAIAASEHALALDRNLAFAHTLIGMAKMGLGRAEETESHILEALRLSPRDVMAYHWMFIGGAAKLALGSDDEAAAWLRRSVEANRNFSSAHFNLAAALALLGRLDEAREAVKAGLALDPNFTTHRLRQAFAMPNADAEARRERIHDAMHKAGVPEG